MCECVCVGGGVREGGGERDKELVVYRKVWDVFPTYFVSCNRLCSQKEKWHGKEHIIIIIIIKSCCKNRLSQLKMGKRKPNTPEVTVMILPQHHNKAILTTWVICSRKEISVCLIFLLFVYTKALDIPSSTRLWLRQGRAVFLSQKKKKKKKQQGGRDREGERGGKEKSRRRGRARWGCYYLPSLWSSTATTFRSIFSAFVF